MVLNIIILIGLLRLPAINFIGGILTVVEVAALDSWKFS